MGRVTLKAVYLTCDASSPVSTLDASGTAARSAAVQGSADSPEALAEQLAALSQLREPGVISLTDSMALDPASWPGSTLEMYSNTTISGPLQGAALWWDLGLAPLLVHLNSSSAKFLISNVNLLNGCVSVSVPDAAFPEQQFLRSATVGGVSYDR